MNWLKHAFAVEPPGPAEPTPEEQAVVEALVSGVVRRRMTIPALAFLEMSRPLNFVGAQALHVLAPLVNMLTDRRGHERLAAFLERRGAVDYICRRLEEAEAAWTAPAATEVAPGTPAEESAAPTDGPENP